MSPAALESSPNGVPVAEPSTGRLAGNFLLHAAAKNLHLVLTILVLSFVAHRDGRTGIGVYATVTALYTTFVTLAPLGLAPLLTREVAREPRRAGAVLASGLAIAAPLGVLAWAALRLVALAGYPPAVVDGCRTIALGCLVFVGAEYAEAVLIGLNRMGAASVVLILENLARTGVSLLLVRRGHPIDDLFWLHPIVRLPAFLGLLALCAAWIPFRTWKPDRETLRVLARGLGILSLTVVAVSLTWRIEEHVLPLFASIELVGVYAAGKRIVTIALGVAASAIHALYPRMARLERTDRASLRGFVDRSVDRMLPPAILVASVLTVAPEVALDPLFGPDFSGARPVLAVGIWLLPLGVLSGMYGRLFYAADRLRSDLFANGVALAATTILLPAGLAAFSVVGAAAALVLGRAGTLAFQALAVARPAGLAIRVEGRRLRALTVATAVAVATGFATRPPGALAAAAAATAAFAFVLWLADPTRAVRFLPEDGSIPFVREVRGLANAAGAAAGLVTVVPIALVARLLARPFERRGNPPGTPSDASAVRPHPARDLLDLLPLSPGGTVLLGGRASGAWSEAVARKGGVARPFGAPPGSDGHSLVDGVLWTDLEPRERTALAAARERLRPGGWICVVGRNPFGLHHLLGLGPEGVGRYALLFPEALARAWSWLLGGEPPPRAFPPSSVRRRLSRAGFAETRLYWLVPDPDRPRWIVPLADPAVASWAGRSAVLRRDFRGIERAALSLLPAGVGARLLCGYALVARP